MPTLTITSGENAGKQFVIEHRPLSIGREPARDIQLVDPKVSRKHALLRRDGDACLIAPAKALNGIVINGNRVESETALRDGDEIQLGATVLRFEVTSDPTRTNALHARKVADSDARERNTMA